MSQKFRPFAAEVERMIAEERCVKILEIGKGDNCYGAFMADCQYRFQIPYGRIDKMLLTEKSPEISHQVYHQVINFESIEDLKKISLYDFILITDLFETLTLEQAKQVIEILQAKVTQQVMVITPEYAQNGKRIYHPVAFMGIDFAYTMTWIEGRNWQTYQFFPKMNYPRLPIDEIESVNGPVQPMRIAFIIPHLGLTGGMKAIVGQIKLLTGKGHKVDVYYRAEKAESALPSWGVISREDYAEQHIVPPGERFLDHIQDTDIIFLAWASQMWEFVESQIPVVMWEQGFEWFYGDYKTVISSRDRRRLNMHGMYRLPVWLMSVSYTNQKVMQGIYNRKTPYCPCGIDTSFYHPSEKNTEELPVILLVGNPSMRFKGFKFAFDVLETLWRQGERFQVKWAAQMGVSHGQIPFPLEVKVALKQEELAALYASSDIYFSTSLYESYPLPPLEAMASGTAVAAVDNGGIQCYAKDGENCLLCPQGDIQAAAEALKILLHDEEKRQRLAEAGRKTALEQSCLKTIDYMENYLYSIVLYHRNKQLETQE